MILIQHSDIEKPLSSLDVKPYYTIIFTVKYNKGRSGLGKGVLLIRTIVRVLVDAVLILHR